MGKGQFSQFILFDRNSNCFSGKELNFESLSASLCESLKTWMKNPVVYGVSFPETSC